MCLVWASGGSRPLPSEVACPAMPTSWLLSLVGKRWPSHRGSKQTLLLSGRPYRLGSGPEGQARPLRGQRWPGLCPGCWPGCPAPVPVATQVITD